MNFICFLNSAARKLENRSSTSGVFRWRAVSLIDSLQAVLVCYQWAILTQACASNINKEHSRLIFGCVEFCRVIKMQVAHIVCIELPSWNMLSCHVCLCLRSCAGLALPSLCMAYSELLGRLCFSIINIQSKPDRFLTGCRLIRLIKVARVFLTVF